MSPNFVQNPPAIFKTPVLFGSQGELVSVRLSVDARHLEELLEGLAELDFPVNPELTHRPGAVVVEFPAYASNVGQIEAVLTRTGLDPASLDVFGVLSSTAAG